MSTLPADSGADGGTVATDNVVTDRELFDHSIDPGQPSPAPSPTPAPSPAPVQQPQPTTQPGQPSRDDRGRFAPQGQPQQPQQRPQQQPAQRQPEDHRVPLRELLDERERRQRIEAEHQQLMQHLQRQQQPQQQGPETIFDGPDEYLNQRVMNPLRQEGYHMMLKVKDDMSREMANQQFGVGVVTNALQELLKVRNSPAGSFAFQQIMSSGHPYGALVKWQQQQRAHAAIGDDPQAWLQQQQQAWFNDPRVRAAMLESIRAGANGGQQQHGNGRAPNVSLPPSLQTVPASSGRDTGLGDLSSESLFAYATKP